MTTLFDFDMPVPLVVSYGLGVDSTALLIGLTVLAIRPDLILFADTGGEKDETYAYRAVMDEYLLWHGFPPVTVVRNVVGDFKNWPPYHTLEGLRAKLLEVTRRAATKIGVPFVNPVAVQRGTITGVHQGNNKYLVRWDGKTKTEQEDRTWDWIGPLTDEEFAELRRLKDELAAANNRYRVFCQQHKLDVREAVEQAMAEALKTEPGA